MLLALVLKYLKMQINYSLFYLLLVFLFKIKNIKESFDGNKLSAAGQAILDKYDYHSIFSLVKEKEKVNELPLQLRNLNVVLIRALAIWIDDELQDPNMLKKLKTMYPIYF